MCSCTELYIHAMRNAQEHLLVINLEGEGRAEEHPGTHGTRLEQSMSRGLRLVSMAMQQELMKIGGTYHRFLASVFGLCFRGYPQKI